MRSRAAGIAAGLATATSAFLPWFRDRAGRCTPCRAGDIPALVLFRYVNRAPAVKLAHLAVALGLTLVIASLLPALLRAAGTLVVGTLVLAGVAAFTAQMIHESTNSHAGSVATHLGVGVLVAALGGLLALTSSALAFAGANAIEHDDEEIEDLFLPPDEPSWHDQTAVPLANPPAPLLEEPPTLVEQPIDVTDTGEHVTAEQEATARPPATFHDAPSGTWASAVTGVQESIRNGPGSQTAVEEDDGIRFCRSCGTAVEPSRIFCGNCGFRVRGPGIS